MTIPDHILVLVLLAFLLVFFVWGRWRYDVVAFAGLIVAVLMGLVPVREAFSGFGHPATMTVAVVLVVSRALSLSGVADYLAQRVVGTIGGMLSHVGVLSTIAAALSAFMNNVGALALLIPVTVQSASRAGHPVSRILMPVSFASLLGGLVTLIGTPPNIIVAAFRGDATGVSFTMFDFTPVGGCVAVAGIAFITLVGWRLIPERAGEERTAEGHFGIDEYLSELRVPKDSPAVGLSVEEIEDQFLGDTDVLIIGIVRRGKAISAINRRSVVKGSDVLLVEASPKDLDEFIHILKLKIMGANREKPGMREMENMSLQEVVVMAGSRIEGRTVEMVRFRRTHSVNLLGVSRQGRPHRGRVKNLRFRVGDVLLLQGEAERLSEIASRLGCLPLAGRGLQFGRRGHAGVAAGLFALGVIAAALGVLPIAIALGVVALIMVTTGVLPVREIYEGIDWPVIVLLGALIPIGHAMESTGATALIAMGLLDVFADLPAWAILLAVLVITMTLSDVLNNAATAVVMAPVSMEIASTMGVSVDAFLMAVAVGASCAFLTPIGHQNNALIMGPGGYRFSDYWRMGLPLEVLIVVVAVPAILTFWPL
ncbi:MAG: sodium-coupled transporter [Rhodospirillales bacterium]|nr:sodium-coupled transporter [Rhodospirillales bacterium]